MGGREGGGGEEREGEGREGEGKGERGTGAILLLDPLTHCLGLGIEPASWCCSDATITRTPLDLTSSKATDPARGRRPPGLPAAGP